MLDEIEEIIVAPYCHADFAWTNTRAWHKCRYIKALATRLTISVYLNSSFGKVLTVRRSWSQEAVTEDLPSAIFPTGITPPVGMR